MNRFFIIVAWMVAAVMSAQARIDDFSRYEVILSRRPFGEPPSTDATPAAVVPDADGPSFADSLRMVALTYRQGNVRAGFVDSSASPPKTYFLFVGESQDGIEVVSASYEEERVVLRKDGVERTLSMASAGGGRVLETARAGAPGAPSRSQAIRRPGMRTLSAPAPGTRTVTTRVLSPGRQARLEEERRRAESVPDLDGAVLEKHLQEYNMEVIRSGAPPLPIPLTEEQDAQLVEEGILPPAEEE